MKQVSKARGVAKQTQARKVDGKVVGGGLRRAVEALASSLSQWSGLKHGSILFVAPDGPSLHLVCERSGVRIADGPPQGRVLLRVTGPADRVAAIVRGKADPQREYLAGGLFVRGDLFYLSELLLERGLIKRPLCVVRRPKAEA